MAGLGVVYQVKKGDTLWDIAEAELGSPWEWPRIYAFNNRDEVVRSGVRRITDPDLIYAGETIRIPRVGPKASSRGEARKSLPAPDSIGARRDPSAAASNTRPERLRDLLPQTFVPFAVSYDLADVPEVAVKSPGFTVRLKLKGNVTVELGKRVPITYVHNKGLEMSLKSQTDHVLGQLLSQTSATFDPATKRASFSNKLISQSNMAGAPKTAIAIEVGTTKPFPVLQATVEYPLLRGRLGADLFLAQKFAVAMEIELDGQQWQGRRAPQPVLSPTTRVFMVVGGALLLGGTLVADVFTCGGSLADDPITIPAALTMIGVGLGTAATVSGGRPIQPSL